MPKTNWSKIWREIAEAYDTPYWDRTIRQEDLTAAGLCLALEYSRISKKTRENFIETFKPAPDRIYWWESDKNGNNYRATFAGFMSAMGDKAFEKLINPPEKKAKGK